MGEGVECGTLTHDKFNVADQVIAQNIFYSMGYYMLPMPSWHPWILVIGVYAWRLARWAGVGYMMLIYLAALQGVPQELKEAFKSGVDIEVEI